MSGILILCLAAYGALYLFGKSEGSLSPRRKKQRGGVLEREERLLKEKIGESAKMSERKKDKISLIAKQKPDRIAAALQKLIIEKNGKHSP